MYVLQPYDVSIRKKFASKGVNPGFQNLVYHKPNDNEIYATLSAISYSTLDSFQPLLPVFNLPGLVGFAALENKEKSKDSLINFNCLYLLTKSSGKIYIEEKTLYH